MSNCRYFLFYPTPNTYLCLMYHKQMRKFSSLHFLTTVRIKQGFYWFLISFHHMLKITKMRLALGLCQFCQPVSDWQEKNKQKFCLNCLMFDQLSCFIKYLIKLLFEGWFLKKKVPGTTFVFTLFVGKVFSIT